jgi:uncharacterized protein YndB with AHSA1/START domain
MDTLLTILIVVLGLVALVFTASSFIPREHAVSVRARFARPTSEVWKVITDVDAIPAWRPDVQSIERRPDVAGLPAWVEHSQRLALPLEVVERDAPRKLVARIAADDGKLAFGGTWTWYLREVPGGCELTVTENGFVANPLFRVLAHFVLGYSRALESYLRDLGAKFGETTTPKVV